MSQSMQVIENEISQLMSQASAANNGGLMLALYALKEKTQLVKDQMHSNVIQMIPTVTATAVPSSPRLQYSITIPGKQTEKVTSVSTITPIQAATISGKSVATINRMLQDGSIVATQQNNGRWSMSVQAVFDAFNMTQPITGRRQTA